MLTVVSVVVALVITLVVWLDLPRGIYRYYRKCKLLRSVPVALYLSKRRTLLWPLLWPLLGDIPAVYKQDEAHYMEAIEELNNPVYKKQHITRIWMGLIATVHVRHSAPLSKLLKEPKSRDIYNVLLPWLGEGLLISENKKWFRNRRLLTPAFHYEILKGYITVYNTCLFTLIEKWNKSLEEGEPVKLFETLSLMSLDIITQSAFSYNSGCQASEIKNPYTRACCELIHLCFDRFMNPLYLVDWLYWLTPHGRKMRQLCDLVHEHAEKIIAERKLSLEYTKSGEEIAEPRKYLDFLDILLKAKDDDGNGMTDLEIRNEVDTFMFEGHDTTTSGMSWTLYCLSRHPEYQDKVREEVRSVLQGREWLEYDDLSKLKYTSWCIKEAMRLYPPIIYFFRKTSQDIEINNYLIPEGVTISVNIMFIHRNPHIWEEPTKYDPLRFQPANIEKHGPHDYIPFSAGHRNCIGQNFAMNEMKVVIGTLVNRFSMKLDETHKVEMVPRVALKTKNDIKLYLEPSQV